MRRRAIVVLAFVAAGAPGVARAGGFELPDVGTQALGRGAAFVAKADDATALYWNPGGLARQRGTRFLANGNFYLQSFAFRRAGRFPDDPEDPTTPWGGRTYPESKNVAGLAVVPFLGATADFGSDRLTLGVAVFSPPIVDNRTFALASENSPAASRYDYIQSRGRLLFPTLGFGYHLTSWLDVGLAAHVVLGSFDDTQVFTVDPASEPCKNAEYQPCDAQTTLSASAVNVGGSFGALVRATPSLAFGLSVRTPVRLDANGTLTVTRPPRTGTLEPTSGDAKITSQLPAVVRLGGRWVMMDGAFEVSDIELDVVYETWGAAQGDGARVFVPRLGTFRDIDAVTHRGYRDTVSLRAGGAYNFDAGSGLLAVRAGGFYETAATAPSHTRVDYDTLAKVAFTLGLGYRINAWSIDIAYAAIASVPRVTEAGVGQIAPINLARRGAPQAGSGDLLPAVNDGSYRGFTHVLSLGLGIAFDAPAQDRRAPLEARASSAALRR